MYSRKYFFESSRLIASGEIFFVSSIHASNSCVWPVRRQGAGQKTGGRSASQKTGSGAGAGAQTRMNTDRLFLVNVGLPV